MVRTTLLRNRFREQVVGEAAPELDDVEQLVQAGTPKIRVPDKGPVALLGEDGPPD